jgi:sulfate transport system permease protein
VSADAAPGLPTAYELAPVGRALPPPVKVRGRRSGRGVRIGLRTIVIAYLVLLLALPVGTIVVRALSPGLSSFWDSLTSADALHAFWLTAICVAVSVVVNTILGIGLALFVVRSNSRFRTLVDALLGIPLAVSPVVVGLALILVYGQQGWIPNPLGIQVIFSTPGMVLATIFVSLPFVAREVIPVLREVGTDQEEAARTLGGSPSQIFWAITLPSIRTAVAYGVVLTTARSLGEFGAVNIVSGRIQGQTQTATLLVQQRYESFDAAGAYAASLLLAVAALLVIAFVTRPDRRHQEAV